MGFLIQLSYDICVPLTFVLFTSQDLNVQEMKKNFMANPCHIVLTTLFSLANEAFDYINNFVV